MSDPLTRLQASLADRYAVEHEIGAGGMATVYLARDVRHDRHVALKVLRPELAAVLGAERFLAEIRITARLDHPHILTLIDSGEADGALYYVLPFVHGESLRDKLTRERQLGLEEALQITRQVASALDYAHRQGVVHRDIKPENILLHEGEAMLADFGIALAVKEAGGNRLTETGLSLGTPQYMSPEQATGGRTLDARSDVYSLAAVLYEMLAGEPPLSGATAQVIIAKLLTERPTSLRVVRDTVPVGIDAAVAKALAKVPADRFAGAGEFTHALDVALAARTGAEAATPVARRRRAVAAVVVAGSLVVAAVAALAVGGRLSRRYVPVTLGNRTQLTFSGGVRAPAISPDGKQLAFFTRSCAAGECTYALEVQDVGGTTTRRVLEHLTAAYLITWSPDRRNLVIIGTVAGRWGTYLVSALGGTPRYLGSALTDFLGGGDSLLLGERLTTPDTVFWLRVQTLAGATRDSVRVSAPRPSIYADGFVVPGTPWLVSAVFQAGSTLYQVMDRRGRIADRVLIAGEANVSGRASRDALWLPQGGVGPWGMASYGRVIRVGLDTATGRLTRHQDTAYTGTYSNFSVTADGGSFVVDEGTYEYGAWWVDVADALRGSLPEERRALHASTPVAAVPSPGGSRLLLIRTLPAGAGRTENRVTVRPAAGGAEIPLNTPGSPIAAHWTDADHVALSSAKGSGLQLSLVDVRSNAVVRSLDLPDSTIVDFDVLPDGWVYLPSTYDRIVQVRGGVRREERKPGTLAQLAHVAADSTGRIFATGWNAGSADSLVAMQVPMDGSPWAVWASMFAERGTFRPLPGGDLLLVIFTTQQSATLYRATAAGRVEQVGIVPRPIDVIVLSRDGRRAGIGIRDYQGDAWMSRVVRP